MRAVVQRVSRASVTVENEIVSEINKGVVSFVGFCGSDSNAEIKYIMDKIDGLRIFEDDTGKMNLSVADIGGEILIVPNFTIYGDVRKGKRPSFSQSASPDFAAELFNSLKLEYGGERIKFGVFQADMKVIAENDGPVTVLLDSGKLF